MMGRINLLDRKRLVIVKFIREWLDDAQMWSFKIWLDAKVLGVHHDDLLIISYRFHAKVISLSVISISGRLTDQNIGGSLPKF